MANGILIFAEITRDRYIHTGFFELANKANELSRKLDEPVMAVILAEPGLALEFKEGFVNSGIDKVFVYEHNVFKKYSTQIYSKLITELVKEIDPSVFLISATNLGRDLAPRISSVLKTGLTADCIDLDINEKGQLAATRPTFGGQLMATILCKTFPQMATVRPKVFKPTSENNYKNTEFIYKLINEEDLKSDVEIINFTKKLEDTINELDSAEIIVSGGKGMKGADGFNLLKQLADKLGGTVGASRGAVDSGYAPQSIQIGQTGKTVTPKIYIACGISGAMQHTCGITGSDHIIAINTDENAPIFNVADTGIVGDAFEIIPQMLENLNNEI